MALIYEELKDRRLGRLLHRRRPDRSLAVETYKVTEDVTETLEDGRTIQVAAKGTEVPIAEARRLGLVKDAQETGPQETKKSKS